MKNFLLLFVIFYVGIINHAFCQERQNEVRPKLDLQLLEQSEGLSNVTGWAKIETAEGKTWKDNVRNKISYI